MKEKEKIDAWKFALGLAKIDNFEPSAELKEMIKMEVKGKITTAEMKERLTKKYTARG